MELPRAQHAFDLLPSIRAHHASHAVERFLAVIRSEQGGATPAEAVDDGVDVESVAKSGPAAAHGQA